MSVYKAVSLGMSGNEISKKLSGTNEVSAGRTALATASGAGLATVATGTLVVGGFVTAPVVVPLAIASGIVAGIASLFD